jgi:hypothetical protein
LNANVVLACCSNGTPGNTAHGENRSMSCAEWVKIEIWRELEKEFEVRGEEMGHVLIAENTIFQP